jgi:hypothetical protein
MTADMLSQSLTDHRTILPNGTQGPYRKFSGAERIR